MYASGSQQSAPVTLSQQELDVAVANAVDAWIGSGLNERQMRSLEQLEVQLAAIPGNVLGFASPTTGQVFIDSDSAGYGRGVYDLGSIVAHEIGHILGYDDIYDDGFRLDVMHGILSPGQTRMPMSSLALAFNDDLATSLDPSTDLTDEGEELTLTRVVAEVETSPSENDDDVSDLLLALVERRRRHESEIDAFFSTIEEEDEKDSTDDA